MLIFFLLQNTFCVWRIFYLSNQSVTATRKVVKTGIQLVSACLVHQTVEVSWCYLLYFKQGDLIAGLWHWGKSVKELLPALHTGRQVRAGTKDSWCPCSSLSLSWAPFPPGGNGLWAGLKQIGLPGACGVFAQKTEAGDQRFNRQKWQAYASALLYDWNPLQSLAKG